jgi:hypothetical protein
VGAVPINDRNFLFFIERHSKPPQIIARRLAHPGVLSVPYSNLQYSIPVHNLPAGTQYQTNLLLAGGFFHTLSTKTLTEFTAFPAVFHAWLCYNEECLQPVSIAASLLSA